MIIRPSETNHLLVTYISKDMHTTCSRMILPERYAIYSQPKGLYKFLFVRDFAFCHKGVLLSYRRYKIHISEKRSKLMDRRRKVWD